jgi:hypothetical protein
MLGKIILQLLKIELGSREPLFKEFFARTEEEVCHYSSSSRRRRRRRKRELRVRHSGEACSVWQWRLVRS